MSISKPTRRRRISGSCPRQEVKKKVVTRKKVGCSTSRRICETREPPSACSSPIRTATVRDGRRMGSASRFLSTKEGGSQVWVAEFDSAQGTVTFPRKVTSLATEADGELWSPDGKHILFISNVYPACDDAPEAEANCNEQKLKEAEQSKVKAMIDRKSVV